MHQYTADLANLMAQVGHDVHLVTTTHVLRDRYRPDVTIHSPASTASTGLSLETLHVLAARRTLRAIVNVAPDVVHFTGPHLWNGLLVRSLAARGIPVVHTLHDLHPHAGAFYGRLLYLWNGWVRNTADHLLVHGQRYRDELLAQGVAPSCVTYTPLAHLFVSHARQQTLNQSLPRIRYEPWALFFARLEVYKGLAVLVEAAGKIGSGGEPPSVVVAGQGSLDELVRDPIPPTVEVRNRLVGDEEAVKLFSRCGLVVLPYVEASQSAIIAAAYYFCKPVIVTCVGALPEYVVEGKTGWVIPPEDPQTLADTMRVALQDPNRLARMGRAGREWYEQQRQAVGATLQKMYEDVAGRSHCEESVAVDSAHGVSCGRERERDGP